MANIDKAYTSLITSIGNTIQTAKFNAVKAINNQLTKANWEIGMHIVEFEQKGKQKAEYGSSLLTQLSADLKLNYGKGFGKSNIYLYRQFYLKYPIFRTVSGKLSWSHYAELLSISDEAERKFYEKSAIAENWSFRELKRQIQTASYQRVKISKVKINIASKKNKIATISKSEIAIKDPYIFEFLGLPKEKIISEKQLETKLINNLQQFLLELGKGFSFVARQYKISIDNQHFFIDLVFYHRILKCFVLIDLKVNKVKHYDIGQMNLYLNYFKEEENTTGDNDPIGIIIAAEKNEFLVKYATGGLSNKIFVSKYQLYLPNQRQLQNQLNQVLKT